MGDEREYIIVAMIQGNEDTAAAALLGRFNPLRANVRLIEMPPKDQRVWPDARIDEATP